MPTRKKRRRKRKNLVWDIHLSDGTKYSKQGEYEKALLELEEAYELISPTVGESDFDKIFYNELEKFIGWNYYKLGEELFDKEKYSSAIKNFEESIKYSEDLYIYYSYINIGISYNNQEDFERALKYYKKAKDYALQAEDKNLRDSDKKSSINDRISKLEEHLNFLENEEKQKIKEEEEREKKLEEQQKINEEKEKQVRLQEEQNAKEETEENFSVEDKSISKYKELFRKKIGKKIDSLSDQTIEKLLSQVNSLLQKDITDTKRYQLLALMEILNEKLLNGEDLLESLLSQ